MSMNKEDRTWITLVSGLPRSGTSLAMAMLRAGGMPVLVDASRPADADNPRGYFEYAPAKRLRHDSAWLGTARGHAVKVISYLLDALPSQHRYRVVFMERALDEVLASQRTMLSRLGRPQGDEALLRTTYEKHLAHIGAWLATQENIDVCRLDYAEVVAAPVDAARRLNAFLGGSLDETAMAAEVQPGLYRQRPAMPIALDPQE
jgi:hypothetical protein